MVATPIGNLADLSLRAVHVLSLMDLVACEDTRVSGGLLRLLGLDKRLLPLHEHNESEAAQVVLRALQEGQRVAYVSDAGTPAVSDPGARLVHLVQQAGGRVTPLPGPSSVTTALSAAGDVAAQGFHFMGFVPAKGAAREAALAAPGVINGTVDGLQQAFDSDSVGTGFNVASMLLGCAFGAFSAGRLADRHGPRRVALLGAGVAALAYALMAGWGVPAQRTVLMLAAVVWLRWRGLDWPWPQVWLWCLALVLALDPWAGLQPGFWLSFVAVGILFATDPGRTQRPSGGGVLGRAGRSVAGLVREQGVVTVALARFTVGTTVLTSPRKRRSGKASSTISQGWPTRMLESDDSDTSASTSSVLMSAMVTTAPCAPAALDMGVMMSPTLAFLTSTTPSKGATMFVYESSRRARSWLARCPPPARRAATSPPSRCWAKCSRPTRC